MMAEFMLGAHPGYPSPWVTLAPGHEEQGLNLVGDVIFAAFHRTALAGGDKYCIVGLHLYRSEVGRGLHQAFEVVAHGDYSVGQA